MTVNIVTTSGQEHNFKNANWASYSEIDDLFMVHVNSEIVFQLKMGDLAEVEIAADL